MTETDPDTIGPDGTVRLRCYLPLEKSLWFSAGCQGKKGCGHAAPISVRAAIQIMGSSEATVGELGRCLRCSNRCSRCGNRQTGITIQPDTRTTEAIERNRPRPETQAGLPD